VKQRQNKNDWNVEASALNHELCKLEHKILMRICHHLQEVGFAMKNCVPCFDGVLVPKHPTLSVHKHLQSAENTVAEHLGVRIKLKIKPMTDVISIGKLEVHRSHLTRTVLRKGKRKLDNESVEPKKRKLCKASLLAPPNPLPLKFNMEKLTKFKTYIKERYAIKERREKEELLDNGKWTTDEVSPPIGLRTCFEQTILEPNWSRKR